MTERHHLWAVAGLLVGRYGRNAGDRADAYARQAERDGDDDCHAIWSDVAGALAHRRAEGGHAFRSGAG
ncbi:MAG TPA: hypothetical protein VD978_35450 [Azospirillum sp.]|nr:hypothetical protein [Azospirillum sp.]